MVTPDGKLAAKGVGFRCGLFQLPGTRFPGSEAFESRTPSITSRPNGRIRSSTPCGVARACRVGV